MGFERARSQRERGTASVEFVLIVPLLVSLVILALISARLVLLKQYNVAGARTAVWQHARFVTDCIDDGVKAFGGYWGRSDEDCESGDQLVEQFLRAVSDGNGGSLEPDKAKLRFYQAQFARAIRRHGGIPDNRLPSLTTGQADANFGPGQYSGLDVTLSSRQAVDAAPVWWNSRRDEVEILPTGYNDYLRGYLNDELGSELLFPDFFPE